MGSLAYSDMVRSVSGFFSRKYQTLRCRCEQLSTRQGRKFLFDRSMALQAGFYLRIASLYRRTLARRQCVIVVVGSEGKTTTARAILQALNLSSDYASGSNNCFGKVAWALLRTPRRQRHVVVEVGIARPGQMERWVRPLRPNIVVVTSIGSEHVMSFRDEDHLRDEKAWAVRCLDPSGIAVLNRDDPRTRWMAGVTRARVIWYGFDSKASFQGTDWTLAWPRINRLRGVFCGHAGEIETELLNRTSSYSLLAAVAAAAAAGAEIKASLANLQGFKPTWGRMQPLHSPAGFWLLLDDFAASLPTYYNALEVLESLPHRRRIVVLGVIETAPKPVTETYRRVVKRLGALADEIVVTRASGSGDYFGRALRKLDLGGVRLSAIHYAGCSSEVSDIVSKIAGPGDIVLFKGRSSVDFREVAETLSSRSLADEFPLQV